MKLTINKYKFIYKINNIITKLIIKCIMNTIYINMIILKK